MQKYLSLTKAQLSLSFSKYKEEVLFIVLSLVVIFIPSIIHNQMITGPVINALLLITVILTGNARAIFLGLIPSTIALGSGLLPVVLAPMIPFIMISNALYAILYNKFYKKNVVVSIILSSVIKFAFLSGAVTLFGQVLLDESFLSKAIFMMTWPQLITSLIGGVIASITLKYFKR